MTTKTDPQKKVIKGTALGDIHLWKSSTGFVCRKDGHKYHLTICINKKNEFDIHITDEDIPQGRRGRRKETLLRAPISDLERVFSRVFGMMKTHAKKQYDKLEVVSLDDIGACYTLSEKGGSELILDDAYDVVREETGFKNSKRNAYAPKLGTAPESIMKHIASSIDVVSDKEQCREIDAPFLLTLEENSMPKLLIKEAGEANTYKVVPFSFLLNMVRILLPIIGLVIKHLEEMIENAKDYFSFESLFEWLKDEFQDIDFSVLEFLGLFFTGDVTRSETEGARA